MKCILKIIKRSAYKVVNEIQSSIQDSGWYTYTRSPYQLLTEHYYWSLDEETYVEVQTYHVINLINYYRVTDVHLNNFYF